MYRRLTGFAATSVCRRQIIASTLCWKSTTGQGSAAGTLGAGNRKSQTTRSTSLRAVSRSTSRRMAGERYLATA
jgi:hypothetical protein